MKRSNGDHVGHLVKNYKNKKGNSVIKDLIQIVERMFGVPTEVTVQRQESSRHLPHVVKCADYVVLSGYRKAIQQLISVFNADWNASLTTLCKCYLASLPEPLTTFVLYHEIRSARSSIHSMRNILKKLPNVNYMTLEFIAALLLHVNQKSILYKAERAKTRLLGSVFSSVNQSFASKKAMDFPPTYSAWDTLSEEDDGIGVSSAILLDDGLPTDFSAIEVVQCLNEHHNAIFTDANETIWT